MQDTTGIGAGTGDKGTRSSATGCLHPARCRWQPPPQTQGLCGEGSTLPPHPKPAPAGIPWAQNPPASPRCVLFLVSCKTQSKGWGSLCVTDTGQASTAPPQPTLPGEVLGGSWPPGAGGKLSHSLARNTDLLRHRFEINTAPRPASRSDSGPWGCPDPPTTPPWQRVSSGRGTESLSHGGSSCRLAAPRWEQKPGSGSFTVSRGF